MALRYWSPLCSLHSAAHPTGHALLTIRCKFFSTWYPPVGVLKIVTAHTLQLRAHCDRPRVVMVELYSKKYYFRVFDRNIYCFKLIFYMRYLSQFGHSSCTLRATPSCNKVIVHAHTKLPACMRLDDHYHVPRTLHIAGFLWRIYVNMAWRFLSWCFAILIFLPDESRGEYSIAIIQCRF